MEGAGIVQAMLLLLTIINHYKGHLNRMLGVGPWG